MDFFAPKRSGMSPTVAIGLGLAAGVAGFMAWNTEPARRLRAQAAQWLSAQFEEPKRKKRPKQSPPPVPRDSLAHTSGLIPSPMGVATVSLAIAHEDLATILRAAFPMRAMIDDNAWLQIDELEDVAYLGAEGIRIVFSAKIHYPLPILPDRFTIEHASVTVKPTIATGDNGFVLAFHCQLGAFDLKYIPDFIDGMIAKKINEVFEEKLSDIAWNFTDTLTRQIALPEKIALLEAIRMGPPKGRVEFAERGLIIRIALPLGFMHRPTTLDGHEKDLDGRFLTQEREQAQALATSEATPPPETPRAAVETRSLAEQEGLTSIPQTTST